MKKRNNTIFWIIGIAILLLVVTKLPVQKEEGIRLVPHYYNNGVEVFPSRGMGLFSFVNPPGVEVDQISFDVYGSNTGEIFIDKIQANQAYPSQFLTALQTGTNYTTELEPGQTNALIYSSALMNATDFESISPVNFWVDMKGRVYSYHYIYADRAYSGNITFLPNHVSHASYSCDDGDVYWYDNWGNREEMKEECGDDGPVFPLYCYDNDVYYDFLLNTCPDTSCVVTTIQVFVEDCGSPGCNNGVCNIACYQENPTISTSCGGLNTGTIRFDDDYPGSSYCGSSIRKKQKRLYDGDWDTYGFSTKGCDPRWRMNYTKPVNALNTSTWEVKDGDARVILNIPQECWDYDANSLYFTIRSIYGSGVSWSCDGGGVIRYSQPWKHSGYTKKAYEEGMHWIIGQ